MARPESNPPLACNAPFGFETDTAGILRAFTALGCTRCQPCRRLPDPWDDQARRRSLRSGVVVPLADAAGLAIDSIHGVFGESVDPSSPDPEHRLRCVALYEDEARLARDLGASMVVVHPAAINPGRGELTPSTAAAAQEARSEPLREVMGRLAEVATRRGVVFLIENLPFSCAAGFDPARLAEAVRSVGSSGVRLCLDTGHAHITAGTLASAGASDVAGAVLACADVLSYLHVHDNDAVTDEHVAPGDGSIDWESLGRALESTGCVAPRMLELFHDPVRLLGLRDAGLPDRLKRWLRLG